MRIDYELFIVNKTHEVYKCMNVLETDHFISTHSPGMLNCSTFAVAVCRKRGNGGVTPQLLFQILTNVWYAVTQHITGGELNHDFNMVFCIRISSMWCLL
jgi:hypothetical protein